MTVCVFISDSVGTHTHTAMSEYADHVFVLTNDRHCMAWGYAEQIGVHIAQTSNQRGA